SQDEPGLVPVPYRCHGIDHDITAAPVPDEWKQQADAQIEAIHHDIHHHREQDDDGPDDGQINSHGRPRPAPRTAAASPGWTGPPRLPGQARNPPDLPPADATRTPYRHRTPSNRPPRTGPG